LSLASPIRFVLPGDGVAWRRRLYIEVALHDILIREQSAHFSRAEHLSE
jgi:hypothetical protein